MPESKVYRLKKEWEHHNVSEVVTVVVQQAAAMAARNERPFPIRMIPDLVADCFEEVQRAEQHKKKAAEPD